MAVELISQILSPTNATYVNGVSAERRFSRALLENSFQKIVEKDGRGVNDKWVKEDDATHAAQVFVNRIVPVKMQPREMGASKNGASYSQNQHYTTTETVGIELLQVLDDPILIPRARQDMIPTDLVATHIELFSARLATILNGATAASKLFASYEADAEGKPANFKTITSTDVANKEVALRVIEANTLLDEGDPEHGIDIFPEDTRIAVVKVGFRPILKAQGVLVIGGANDAYEILKGGSVEKEGTVRKLEDGYIGTVDGVPFHVISNESLQHASEYLGFDKNELKGSPLIGYLASSYANARGVSTADRVKVVDDPNGQGVRLQPYVKFGVKSWYPLGNVVLSDVEYNPFKILLTLFDSYKAGIAFKLKGAGSRLVPSEAATIGSVSASGFTFTGLTANDDWNVDHLVAFAYFIGTSKVNTIHGFGTGYAAASYKGVVAKASAASAVSTTIADTNWINVLAISDDGSIRFYNKQYEA